MVGTDKMPARPQLVGMQDSAAPTWHACRYAAELGLDVELVELNMRSGDHKSDWFLKINPFGKARGALCTSASPFWPPSASCSLHRYQPHPANTLWIALSTVCGAPGIQAALSSTGTMPHAPPPQAPNPVHPP